MKKSIFLLGLLVLALIGLTSCESCKSNKITDDYNGVTQNFTAGVDKIQNLHRQTMYTQVCKEYEWRNSNVIFSDSIKTDNLDSLHIVDVTDVFQWWDNGPKITFISTNIEKGTLIAPPITDVWIEDGDLSEKQLKLSAEDVLKRLAEWNGVIPPATSMSLRYPVGPCECNAQWVIGDVYDVIFIDAVTGEISNWNPAFNPNNKAKGGDFGKPLGEWP